MDRQTAVKIIKDTFERAFDKGQFFNFSKNLVNFLDTSKSFTYQGNMIPDAYEQSIQSLERMGKYKDTEDNKIDVLIVRLKKEYSLERARTMQRNFVAWYLNGSRGHELKDAALVAFVSPDERDWRFSLVRMDYNIVESPSGKIKVETELTPARRYSFLVGETESSHTAQVQLLPILENDKTNPLLSDVEKAFSIEVVTREFFNKYRELFHNVEEALENIVKKNEKVKADFAAKGVDTINFSKKLLGQIVFLYFLQKKGWFGVGRDEDWGTGPKNFLRLLFEKKIAPYQNFFNDVLEPLFYEALALERADDFYSRFNCKIPFLNGGLFDPINNYDWVHTDILLLNQLFSNSQKTKEGDVGTGILDVFDRYNFTVKEDEPLDKEVAIDPEMLGKVFENLLEVKDRKSKGTYYTPREIVHYMCQESLINYLDTAINTGGTLLVHVRPPQGKFFGQPDPEQSAFKTVAYRVLVPREDIENFVHMGEFAIEHDTRVETYGKETERYSYKLSESIRQNARLIDEKLASIRVCDPAIGSGAFPVSLMSEIVRARNTLTTYLADKEGRANYNFKRHAIQNCLYGVDIDPGAVEIAKLRLWLSLVVDEEDIKQIQPLPNLDYKIVCGNSLLGVERNMFNNELFQMLEELKPVYFNETNAKKKQEHRKQIDRLIIQVTNDNETFDFEVYFSEVFHEKGGFDIIIANPPYVTTKYGKIDSDLKKAYTNNYESAYDKLDLYVLFIEKAVKISRQYGHVTLITPWNFLANFYSFKLRKFLLENTKIILFNKLPPNVFSSVIVDNIISIFEKNKRSKGNQILFDDLFDRSNKRYVNQDIYTQNDRYVFTLPGDVVASAILEKMKINSTELGKIALNYIGIMTGSQKKMIADKPIFRNSKPVLSGKDIDRWVYYYKGSFVNFDKSKIHSNDNEEVYLSDRKILLRKTGRELVACLDEEQYFTIQSLYNIVVRDKNYSEEYLLSLLNSKLSTYIYNKFFITNPEVFPYIKRRHLDLLPVKQVTEAEQKPFISLIDKILVLTKDKDYHDNPAKQSKVKEYERQIDQMVYELYGLTPEEIAVVEGTTRD